MTSRIFNPIETLLMAWAYGVVLARSGDAILIETAQGKEVSAPHLIDHLKANKVALLAVLPVHDQSQTTEIRP